MEKITSEQNQRVKRAMKLHTSRGRRQQQRIIVFGVKEIKRAIENGVVVDEVFVCTGLLNEDSRPVFESLSESEVPLFHLSENVFQKICYGDRSDGIVLVARPSSDNLKGLLDRCEMPEDSALIIVLESVEKPGNVGAVFRTADAVGASAVVLADPVTSVFHPNSIRSSLGTVFSVPSAIGSSTEVIDWLTENRFSIFPAIIDAETVYTGVDLRGRAAIVFGSESQGLSETWQNENFRAIKIGMAGAADSLNVSVSAAVVAFEAKRQRLGKSKPGRD